MLKRMRRRFVGAAMAAIGTVILVLLLAINLWNYYITTQQQDETLKTLQEFDQNDQSLLDTDEQMPGAFGASPEMQFMIRFFTVHYDTEGNVVSVGQDYIASVTQEEAEAYGQSIMDSGRASGFYQSYRYLMTDTSEGTTIIFLNAERELASMRTLLLVSCAVALGSLLAVFLLVLAFSRRAIAPYIRNIETQKQFITDASHELKTPLTSIATSADILALEREEDEWVQNIKAQCVRLSKLISNLVTLSRLDEAQPFPEPTEFSLSDVVWEIAEPMAALAKARGRRYSQSIQDGITLRGDRGAVGQMVSILLDNAIKYSDEDGEISLTVRAAKRRAEVVVYNTCETMERRHLDRLFDRFYRPDRSRSAQTGGTGIGLSIARATMEAHGGKIRAESKTGRDITFTATFPWSGK